MEVLRINLKDSSSWSKVHKLMKEVFLSRGTAIFPTDTVYGLGCNAWDGVAASKIFLIKKRTGLKPLPVFVEDIARAKSCASINKMQECFLKSVWPGRVTAVLKRTARIPDNVAGGEETVSLRVPDFPFLNSLMSEIDFSVVGTSANISGEPSISDSRELIDVFKNENFKPDLLVDAGVLPTSEPSTVVDLTKLAVLREGAVSEEEIFRRWGECAIEKLI